MAAVDEVDLFVVGAEHQARQQANETGTTGDVEDGLARLDVGEPDESLIAVDAGEVIGGPRADVFGAIVCAVHAVVLVVVRDAVQGLGWGSRGHLGRLQVVIRFVFSVRRSRRLQRVDGRCRIGRQGGVWGLWIGIDVGVGVDVGAGERDRWWRKGIYVPCSHAFTSKR